MARVLLLHDDLGEAARLRRVLREGGHDATLTTSAADADALASRCDVAVVDLRCDAGEALAWARRDGAPPAVVLGDADAAAPLPAVAAPADPAALLAAIAAAAGRARATAPSAARIPAPPAPLVPPRIPAPPAPLPPPRIPGPPAPPAPPRIPGPPDLPTAPPTGPRPGLARTAEAALRALFGGRPARGMGDAVARLDSLLHLARDADYFELLGLERTCTGEEARLAAGALLATLDRDLEAGGADEASVAGLGEVRQVVLDARDVLGDDALRIAYARALTDA